MKTIFLKTFMVLLVAVNASPLIAQNKTVVFNYHKPYQTKYADGVLLAKASVESASIKGYDQLILDRGYRTGFTQQHDTTWLWLPVIGQPEKIQFTSASQKISHQQLFTPLVSDDWGYFKNGRIHVICSSHQDIAWMNTPDSCRHERVHDIVLPALDLIDEHPEFKFEMEQSLNLMEAIEDAPHERQRIIKSYQSGNFEWGATFTQPYEGLESGEQLVRQTYLGRKWIKDNLPGMDAKVAYNIDVPGRSLQVPQILSKAGIDYLFVSRMKEGFYNWHSPDGSKILTYSPGNYGWSLLIYKYLEEDAITALQKLNQVLKNWNDYYQEHHLSPHYALVISTDAGGPKYYEEVIGEWNEIASNSKAGIPQIQHSTADEFLNEINTPEARFDSISGERPNLWVYIHGAAHYEAIKAKKQAAVNVPAAETFSTINSLLENSFEEYPQKELFEAWYKSIYPDHGWGGKNGAITDSIFQASLEQGNEIGQKILRTALENISDKVSLPNKYNVIVYNDLSWPRNGTAKVDISGLKGDNWVLVAPDGERVPAQIVENQELVFQVENVPSIGYKTYQLKKERQKAEVLEVTSNYCENDFYKITFGNGGITSLYDKQLEKEMINSTRFAAGDLLYMGYDGHGAGEFVQVTEPNLTDFEELHLKSAQWEQVVNGDIFSVFQASYQMADFKVIQKITVYHQKKQIDFEYDIPDWTGRHNRQIRAAFPLNMKEDAQVSYDVPMGMIHVGKDEMTQRPKGWAWGGTYWQKPAEIRPREIQNFMTASDSQAGLTISTNVVTADWVDPTREKADYTILNFVLLSTHKSCHGLGNWYHQTGAHEFKFSLSSHEPGWKNGYHFGVEGNHPFHVVQREGKQQGALPIEKGFVTTSDALTKITALKKAENDDNVVLRILEVERQNKEVSVTTNWNAEAVYQTNLIEETPNLLPHSGNEFKAKLEGSAIETYKLELK